MLIMTARSVLDRSMLLYLNILLINNNVASHSSTRYWTDCGLPSVPSIFHSIALAFVATMFMLSLTFNYHWCLQLFSCLLGDFKKIILRFIKIVFFCIFKNVVTRCNVFFLNKKTDLFTCFIQQGGKSCRFNNVWLHFTNIYQEPTVRWTGKLTYWIYYKQLVFSKFYNKK